MTDYTPPTDTDFDEEGQAEADQLAGTDVPALLAEVRRQRTELAEMRATIERLRSELTKEQRLHGDTIDDRDRAQDAADKLAYAIASEEVIGEHTADNCPWANALDELHRRRVVPPSGPAGVAVNAPQPGSGQNRAHPDTPGAPQSHTGAPAGTGGGQ